MLGIDDLVLTCTYLLNKQSAMFQVTSLLHPIFDKLFIFFSSGSINKQDIEVNFNRKQPNSTKYKQLNACNLKNSEDIVYFFIQKMITKV